MPSCSYKLLITGLLFVLSLLLLPIQSPAQSEWPQWGGPGRNFGIKLEGPCRRRGRQRDQINSGPVHWAQVTQHRRCGNTLYTMYSDGEEETVIALAADTGKTIWEHKYDRHTPGSITSTELDHTRRRCWLEICFSLSARGA